MIREATKKGYTEAELGDSINLAMPESKTRRGRVGKAIANTLDTSCNQGVCVPVITPDRVKKRQNGRRFKENGDAAFTLTAQNIHGVELAPVPEGVPTIWSEKYQCDVAVRRLTPRECFRLQGWDNEYFERAALINSDSQLYKQAGNGVTVPVIREIAERMEEKPVGWIYVMLIAADWFNSMDDERLIAMGLFAVAGSIGLRNWK